MQHNAGELVKLSRRLERERKSRLEAEAIAEKGLRELYEKQQYLQLLEKIADVANQSTSLRDALHFAIKTVCEFTGWMLGHAYQCEPFEDSNRLVSTSIWYASEPSRVQAFRTLSETTDFNFGVGLPGRILATASAAWIVDVANDSNFPRAQAAAAAGIKSAFAFPILVRSEVVGVLEFFSDRVFGPDEMLLRLMSQVGTQLGRVVERKQAEDRRLADQATQYTLDRRRLIEESEDKLREQHLRLDIALNNMQQGLLLFDSESRVVLCNQRYLEMYGLSPETTKPGCTLRDLLQQRMAAGTFKGDPDQYIAKFVDKGKIDTKVVALPDGRCISVTNHPAPGGGWVSTHSDVTEQTRAAKELARTKTFLDTVIENVPATLIVKDARNHRYVFVNRAGEELFGMARDQMIGKTAHDFFPKEEADAIAAHDDEVLTSRQQLFIENNPVQVPSKGERLITTKRLAIPGDDGKPQYLLSVIEDVTERRQAEARIAHMAHHDALTDLPNRTAFTQHLAAALDQAAKTKERFAVLCTDLDHFKEVNDVFGHTIGDTLLREVSRRLKAAAGDVFLARLGGDEFTVIATDDEQPSSAEALAERLLGAVSGDIELEGQLIRIGLSIGVAIYPIDGADMATLLGNADAALYRAKAEGRGSIRFFEPDMDKRLRERRALQHDLRTAVARGDLALHYQPQAQIGGQIVGFEALLRWQHPTRGMVPPNTFIPVAEETGLIISIGEWVLREACREAASWPRPLQIAVNLSPVQFKHGDLPTLIHSVLLETGLAASRLELEITEGVLIGDFSRAVSILRRLKTLGVRIAMDDFGTGYSSLSYLQSFPFDKIKIDRTFISNLSRNPQSATIIRAIIGLGHGLDLPIVAEGVETQDQLTFLTRESCDEVQGYLIGRPGPINDFAQMTGCSVAAGRESGMAS